MVRASGAKRVTVNLDLERADAKRRFYGKGKLADAHQLREANSVAEKAPVDSDCVRVFRPNNSLFEVAANSPCWVAQQLLGLFLDGRRPTQEDRLVR